MKEQAAKNTLSKERKEKILDWAIGTGLVIAGIAGLLAGIKSGHISIIWPILGLAGISIFVDTFIKSKVIKIVLNILFAAALVVTFFIVRDFNARDTTSNRTRQQIILERTNE